MHSRPVLPLVHDKIVRTEVPDQLPFRDPPLPVVVIRGGHESNCPHPLIGAPLVFRPRLAPSELEEADVLGQGPNVDTEQVGDLIERVHELAHRQATAIAVDAAEERGLTTHFEAW